MPRAQWPTLYMCIPQMWGFWAEKRVLYWYNQMDNQNNITASAPHTDFPDFSKKALESFNLGGKGQRIMDFLHVSTGEKQLPLCPSPNKRRKEKNKQNFWSFGDGNNAGFSP